MRRRASIHPSAPGLRLGMPANYHYVYILESLAEHGRYYIGCTNASAQLIPLPDFDYFVLEVFSIPSDFVSFVLFVVRYVLCPVFFTTKDTKSTKERLSRSHLSPAIVPSLCSCMLPCCHASFSCLCENGSINSSEQRQRKTKMQSVRYGRSGKPAGKIAGDERFCAKGAIHGKPVAEIPPSPATVLRRKTVQPSRERIPNGAQDWSDEHFF